MGKQRLLFLLFILALVGAFGVWNVERSRPFNWTDAGKVVNQVKTEIENRVPTSTAAATSTQATKIQTNAAVVRVVDGDTIDVKLDAEPNKEYKVRLLGVNTPETVDPRRPVQCFGKEASDFTKHTLNGKRIKLEADPQADERDKYDRLLRNIFLEDGTDFNALLVKDGYAQAYVSFPQNPARKVELRKLESEAKAAGAGMWAPGACQ
ncbi:MAG: thermonuclease family protein [Patescibacteria group bacterium]|nr:thermonuclease family protein [Patescibacteria group bacterium]